MKHLMFITLAAATLAGCNCCRECDKTPVAVSPDGRNLIRLSADKLAFSVERDGVLVAGPAEIGLTVDGRPLAWNAADCSVEKGAWSGKEAAAVYKKGSIDLAGNWTYLDFGDWGVRLAARNDGVAYRLELKQGGTIDAEKGGFRVPDGAKCWYYRTGAFGAEECVAKTDAVKDVKTAGKEMIYAPFVYRTGRTSVAVTDSDVKDYPFAYWTKNGDSRFDLVLERWPKKTVNVNWGVKAQGDRPLRKLVVTEHEDYLVKADGARTLPWRLFLLADCASKFCEADAVSALARPAAKDHDFSWVKPGKVAWDWWNNFDNADPQAALNGGCNTKTYERFIDFAAKNGVEYVIFDEGWSETLNIWKYAPAVDVPHLIEYANARGVGIILWMAWAQAYGDEEHVAEYFSKLGAKGFKVDFMDRADADMDGFLWKFAEACRKYRMVVDYHGVCRPAGMSRAYPNVLNFEGIHGLEQMKWYNSSYDFMASDVRSYFMRLTCGPMDYTPGAMDNYPIGSYPKPGDNGAKSTFANPGSCGTRCHQMAMMALYEAPLQMLADSPTKYEKNPESFKFMAATPVVWDDVVGLPGCLDTCAAVARRAKDGSWYAAVLNNAEARDYELDLAFLGSGDWTMESFGDAPGADREPAKYVHATSSVKAGRKHPVKLAAGGGFVARFVRK